jgi:hypothetical protein
MEIETDVVDCIHDVIEKVVRKEYKRRYHEQNKEKINLRQRQKYKENKELTEEQKQKRRDAVKRYRDKNKDNPEFKEKERQSNARQRLKHREKLNQKCREWYHSNQEYIKAGRKSEKGVRQRHINHWRAYPVKLNCDFPTWEELYGYYCLQDKCELCDEKFYSQGRKNNKNLDHNHTTNQFRWVVCSKCNNKLGKTDKYFNMLMKELKLITNLKSVMKTYLI